MQKLDTLIRRLRKIGIELRLVNNVPWIYIAAVNGHLIPKNEYYYGNHGYTLGFSAMQIGVDFEFLDLARTFDLIRRYQCPQKPIHKYDGGSGVTLCHKCRVIISTGYKKDLYCKKCKVKNLEDMR